MQLQPSLSHVLRRLDAGRRLISLLLLSDGRTDGDLVHHEGSLAVVGRVTSQRTSRLDICSAYKYLFLELSGSMLKRRFQKFQWIKINFIGMVTFDFLFLSSWWCSSRTLTSKRSSSLIVSSFWLSRGKSSGFICRKEKWKYWIANSYSTNHTFQVLPNCDLWLIYLNIPT